MGVEVIGRLCQVVIDVVADMSFICLTTDPGGETEEGLQQLRAELPVRYPFTGKFLLTIQSSLIQEITCNICSDEIDPSNIESQRDALCELLNTIAGRMLQLLAPSAAKYELGLPAPVTDDAGCPTHPAGCPSGGWARYPAGNAPAINLVFYSKDGCLVFSLMGSDLIYEVMK